MKCEYKSYISLVGACLFNCLNIANIKNKWIGIILLRGMQLNIRIILIVKILPQDCIDVIKGDPSLICARPDPKVYRCCKCRYLKLFI